jgi:predicted HTH domain antitoxin
VNTQKACAEEKLEKIAVSLYTSPRLSLGEPAEQMGVSASSAQNAK